MADKPSFNLVAEPWIPVLTNDGEELLVSLDTLFKNARKYRALSHELPTVNVAIFRIILAIFYRANLAERFYEDEDEAVEHWEMLWADEGLYLANIAEYLARWFDRFDLCDEEKPFFQTPGMHTKNGEVKPITLIIPDVEAGPALYTTRTTVDWLTPAEAAQMLIHAMSYDCAGIKTGVEGDPRVKDNKSYPMGTGVCGQLGVTIFHGRNLAETILLNYVPLVDLSYPIGLPVWEVDPPKPGPTVPEPVQGRVSLLTWPQRRILLHWEDDRATGVVLTNGDPVNELLLVDAEAMSPWYFDEELSKKQKRLVQRPLKLSSGRAMWKSLSSYVPLVKLKQIETKWGAVSRRRPAKSAEWLMLVMGETKLGIKHPITMSMVSMKYGSKAATYSDIVVDSLELPGTVFSQGPDFAEFRILISDMVGATNKICFHLKDLYKDLLVVAGNREKVESVRKQIDAVETNFYQQVDRPYRSWLRSLESQQNLQDARAEWLSEAVLIARRIGMEIVRDIAPSTWGAIRNSNDGEALDLGAVVDRFNSRLSRLVVSVAPKTDGRQS